MVQAKKLELVSNELIVMAVYTLTPTQYMLKMTNQKYNIFYKLIITPKHLYIETEIKNIFIFKNNSYYLLVKT